MKSLQPPITQAFAERIPDMLEAIEFLVNIESPSSSIVAVEQMAESLATYVTNELGDRARIVRGADGRPHVRVDFGERADVILVGHFDTVYPMGTLAETPFRREGDRAYGPGVLDMKGGLVMMVEVVRYLKHQRELPNVTLFFNSDEEIASFSSGPLLRAMAADAQLIVALEYTNPAGDVKIGARGQRSYRLHIHGHGGHAAYPELNYNPVDALADVIVQARVAHRPEIGQVVVPTVLQGARLTNVVPDTASVHFDVRVSHTNQFDAVDAVLRSLSVPAGFTIELVQEYEVPVHTADFEGYPYRLAKVAAETLGIEVECVEARGASDANQVAPVNANACEALGAAGGGSHSEREHIVVSLLPRQCAMCTLMVEHALDDAEHYRGPSGRGQR